MRACELELLRANGAEPCLLMDTGGETGRISFSEAGLALRSNPNLLDNWYFVDPVNQRGQTEYTALGYTIDRWFLLDGSIIYNNNGAIISGIIAQRIEPTLHQYLIGKTVTYSILTLDNILVSLSGVWLSESNIEKTEQGLNIIFGGKITGYGQMNPIVTIRNTVSSKTLLAAKLELGDKQTLAHQDATGNWVLNDQLPNKALELAKCQRYQLFGNLVAIPTTKTGNTIYCFLQTPVSLRSTPSLVGTFIARSSENNDIVSTTIHVNQLFSNGVSIMAENAGENIYIYSENVSGLDANL